MTFSGLIPLVSLALSILCRGIVSRGFCRVGAGSDESAAWLDACCWKCCFAPLAGGVRKGLAEGEGRVFPCSMPLVVNGCCVVLALSFRRGRRGLVEVFCASFFALWRDILSKCLINTNVKSIANQLNRLYCLLKVPRFSVFLQFVNNCKSSSCKFLKFVFLVGPNLVPNCYLCIQNKELS